MKRFPHIPDREYAFGMIFNVANQCQSVLDNHLAPYDITTKQWYLSVIVNALFESPPQISDVAKVMNTSHQNVKVIAEKLAKKGHLTFVPDSLDQRKVRLKMTKQSIDFWQELTPQSEAAMADIFSGIDPDQLRLFNDTLTKMLDNLDRMKENGK
jgi:MarR family transcriptional regulator, transcriptional regulator for hemolysin